jgi:hypothetical protein
MGLKHILLTIKCLLIAPNPESALNEEAGRLLLEEYDHIISMQSYLPVFMPHDKHLTRMITTMITSALYLQRSQTLIQNT